jgi:hypothetical protein
MIIRIFGQQQALKCGFASGHALAGLRLLLRGKLCHLGIIEQLGSGLRIRTGLTPAQEVLHQRAELGVLAGERPIGVHILGGLFRGQ